MILVMGCHLVTYIQQDKHNGFLRLHSFPDNLKINTMYGTLHYEEEILDMGYMYMYVFLTSFYNTYNYKLHVLHVA